MDHYMELRKWIDSIIEQAAHVRGEIDCVAFKADQHNALLDTLRQADSLLDDAVTIATDDEWEE
jgi:hypothetical protein